MWPAFFGKSHSALKLETLQKEMELLHDDLSDRLIAFPKKTERSKNVDSAERFLQAHLNRLDFKDLPSWDELDSKAKLGDSTANYILRLATDIIWYRDLDSSQTTTKIGEMATTPGGSP